jgi:hypothetical protein
VKIPLWLASTGSKVWASSRFFKFAVRENRMNRKKSAMRSRETVEPSLVPVRLVVADLFRAPEHRGELAAQPSCFLERLSVLVRQRNGRVDLACWNQEAEPRLC